MQFVKDLVASARVAKEELSDALFGSSDNAPAEAGKAVDSGLSREQRIANEMSQDYHNRRALKAEYK